MNTYRMLFFAAVSALTSQLVLIQPAPAEPSSVDLIDLQQQIIEQESEFNDIVIGAEKTIRWFNNERGKTQYAIVYMHGFSASRQELSPTTERVADAIGANVFYTRLTGHGRSDDAMALASVDAWKNDTQEAFEIGSQIGEKVILIGTSTGATLATWLLSSTQLSPRLAANIMISPNYGLKSKAASILNWPMGLSFAKWVSGDYRGFEPVSEKHALYWTERYPLEAVVPMLNIIDEVNETDKSSITVPQLIIYSPNDQVINVDQLESVVKEFSASQVTVRLFTESTDHVQHVLSGDACSPDSTDVMVKLLASYIDGDFALN